MCLKELRDDREIVLTAVSEHPAALEDASERLRGDRLARRQKGHVALARKGSIVAFGLSPRLFGDFFGGPRPEAPGRLGRVPPCAVKTCAVRPVFARVVGELQAADPSNVQGPVQQNASPGEQSEAPRPSWKPGQEQNPGPENQDSQHMLDQPRGYFPERHFRDLFRHFGPGGPERPL